jgi:hypothetical protein
LRFSGLLSAIVAIRSATEYKTKGAVIKKE